MSVTRIGQVLQGALLQRPVLEGEASHSVPVPRVTVIGDSRFQKLLKQTVATSAQAADVLVALVTPSALIALAMGLWRLTADLGWTETFPITTGFFSHWHVWIALAIALKFGAAALAAKLNPIDAAAKSDR